MSSSASASPQHQGFLFAPIPQRVVHLKHLPPLSPSDFMVQFLRIEASINKLFRAKNPEMAKISLKKLSFEKYPAHIQVRLYNMLSITHLYLKEWEAAWKTAKAGLSLNPDEPNEKAPLLFHQAMSLHYLGYTELAEKEFRKILSLHDLHSDLTTSFRAEIQRVCPSAIE